MILWVDDVREAPNKTDYIVAKSVHTAIAAILEQEYRHRPFEYIDIDHDAGDYASDGGDYIRLLDWLEVTGRVYPIRIHSMNVVGRENMRAIIHHNGWREIQS